MRALPSEVIRELWSEHFPRRNADPWSATLCLAFRLTVEEVAARQVSGRDDLIHRVREVLAVIGIPRDEFYQLEKETAETE
jgi:hypothetical protein